VTATKTAAPEGPPAAAWARRPIVRRVATNLMRIVPIPLLGLLFPRRTIGFCYHLASDLHLPHVRHLYAYKSPEQFEADLVFLKENYHVASYDELVSGRRTPRNSAVLTFDDGLAECFTVVRPLLLKHGLPCTFFVSPPHLDNRRMYFFNKASLILGALTEMDEAERLRRLGSMGDLLERRFLDLPSFARWFTTWLRTLRVEEEPTLDRLCALAEVNADRYLALHQPYMTTDQVRTLAADGFTIGGHALRHVALGAFPNAAITTEIVESCRVAAELSGARRVPFAFPYDANGVDRDLLARLRAEEPWIDLFFDTGEMIPDREFMINRIIVDGPGVLGGPGRSNIGGYLRNLYLDDLLGIVGGGAVRRTSRSAQRATPLAR
jgi:peptidoglycan/xylan/chitin deacetylase (PgdA/CDA1 family)